MCEEQDVREALSTRRLNHQHTGHHAQHEAWVPVASPCSRGGYQPSLFPPNSRCGSLRTIVSIRSAASVIYAIEICILGSPLSRLGCHCQLRAATSAFPSLTRTNHRRVDHVHNVSVDIGVGSEVVVAAARKETDLVTSLLGQVFDSCHDGSR